jgi:hypothetical protein
MSNYWPFADGYEFFGIFVEEEEGYPPPVSGYQWGAGPFPTYQEAKAELLNYFREEIEGMKGALKRVRSAKKGGLLFH